MIKICFISSCGGHFMELQQLFPIGEGYNFYVITEKNIASIDIVKKYKYYLLIQQERRNWKFIFQFVTNLLKSLWLVIKEHPTHVITTGAGAVFPTCLFAKICRSKIIYIESFAKINSKSMTGKLIYLFADRFYVQWEELLFLYPKAYYNGQIY
jgi:UDP-N-acetylglucosamine:LPS N-acetylglucosamine transferase